MRAAHVRTTRRVTRTAGLGFFLATGIGASVSLATVPIILRIAGPQAWSGVALSQSLGALFSVVVGMGWVVIGPSKVSRLPARQRGIYYLESLCGRIGLALLVSPLFVVTVLVLSPAGTQGLANVFAGFGAMTGALGGGWYFVGSRAPSRLLVYDAVPRAAGTIVALGSLSLSGSVVTFGLVQAATSLFSAGLTAVSIALKERVSLSDIRVANVLSTVRENRVAPLVTGASTTYAQLPVVLVASVAPRALPAYALIDKFEKFALFALSPVTQVAQSFLAAEPGRRALATRVRKARFLGLSVAATSAVAFALLAPYAAVMVSGGSVSLDWQLRLSFALALGTVAASGVLGMGCLTAIDRTRFLARLAVTASSVGLPLALVIGRLMGATGVAWTIATVETAVVLAELIEVSKWLRRPSLLNP